MNYKQLIHGFDFTVILPTNLIIRWSFYQLAAWALTEEGSVTGFCGGVRS
ncbi:hypothetical protein ACLBOM_37600 [Escherichia coli]